MKQIHHASIFFCHLSLTQKIHERIHQDLDDAVQTCGGSRITAIRRVYIPLLSTTISYVAIWTALLSYREVTMALFLQSPRNIVLSTAIWERWQSGEPSGAAALGTLMIVVMGAVIVALMKIKPQLFVSRINT